MKSEIKVPAMGESVVEATIGHFLKPSGTQVQENEEIVELETEKVNQVLYSPHAGVVNWKVQEGQNVTIGQVIGEVDSEAVSSVAPPLPPPKKAETPVPPLKEEKGMRYRPQDFVEDLKQREPEPQPLVTPKKEAPAQSDKRETRRPLSKIRKTVATRLVNVLHESAMLTTFNEVDMSAVMDLRARHKESFQKKHEVKLGFMSFFVKAVVDALHLFPDVNSYIAGDEIAHRDYYDISIAVSTERGLFVPVVRGCDHLSFAEIERTIEQLAKKAREGRIAIEDLQGGGFTITNGGVYGSLLSTPILNPPQSGILGMHKIQKRPVVVGDQIVIRPMMYLALSYDHRIVDGKEAVSFLVRVKEVLEDPSLLLFDEV